MKPIDLLVKNKSASKKKRRSAAKKRKLRGLLVSLRSRKQLKRPKRPQSKKK